jgi:transcriptional regulator with XRE-family HTH domain
MVDKELIDKIRRLKEENHYTLFDLSRKIDIQVATLERWLKTNHINKVYAGIVRERLGIK